MTKHHASACASQESLPALQEQWEKLRAEINDMDAGLRAFMAAENPEQGIVHAEDIHRLRQGKLQKRLEMEYCQAKIRFLQSGHAGLLQ